MDILALNRDRMSETGEQVAPANKEQPMNTATPKANVKPQEVN